MTGDWPPDMVGHKDDNSGNNKWSNLKLMTSKEHHKNHSEKLKEVYKDKPDTPVLKREYKASFSNDEVNKAVEEFIKNKTLVNGEYV